jgi:hypothetical protein
MELLDFKILILLGLAIVIYFLYKELEIHRQRLTLCEEKIKELKYLSQNTEFLNENYKVNSVQNTEFLNENYKVNSVQNTEFLNDKNLSILLPIKTLNEPVKQITETSLEETSSEISENVKLSLSAKNNLESKIESDTKHLEIYSNDNDNNLETTISDSLMISKSNNNLETSISDSLIIPKLEKIRNNTEISDSEQKIIISDSEQKIVITNNEKNDLNTLSKMKLIELQNIAKNKNLSLDKKVNGHFKKKTKQELIDELCKI